MSFEGNIVPYLKLRKRETILSLRKKITLKGQSFPLGKEVKLTLRDNITLKKIMTRDNVTLKGQFYPQENRDNIIFKARGKFSLKRGTMLSLRGSFTLRTRLTISP